MSPEQVFTLANTIALLSWLLLAIRPRQQWVTDVITGKAVPAIFGVLYVAIVATMFGEAEGSFSTLGGVASIFSNQWLLLAGWVHYLAFDLLIGTWEVQDARERHIPRMLLVPSLFLTFLFGPAGWLLYMGVREVRWSKTRTSAPRA